MQRTRALLLFAGALVALAALVPSELVQAGACARPGDPIVAVVPTAEDVLPADANVLVQIVGFSDRSLGPAQPQTGMGTASMFALGARLEREGHAAIALRVEEIGPSVARLVPARRPDAGRWRVVSPHGSVEVSFGAATAPPMPAAPELESLATSTNVVTAGPGSGSFTSTMATLRAQAGPPTWQGLVAFQATGATTEIAIAARALNGTSSSHYVYASPGRCGYEAPGQGPPPSGSLVRVALYDLWGRVSPRSRQVRVR
jgi:hypothetical protein